MANKEVIKQFRITPETEKIIEELAREKDRSQSWIMRQLIQERLALLPGFSVEDDSKLRGLVTLLKTPGLNQIPETLDQASEEELDVITRTLLDLVRKAGIG